MRWVHSDVECLNEDLLVGGGMGHALGIVVGCLTCYDRRFICLWFINFDGYGVVSNRSDNVVGG